MAELLAISPRVMNYKIKTLGIDFPEGRRPVNRGSGELGIVVGESVVQSTALTTSDTGHWPLTTGH